MSERKQKVRNTARLMGKNALLFAFNVSYTLIFQQVFGPQSVLPSVALCVGLTMIPFADYGIRTSTMVGLIYALYLGGGLTAQLALASPWAAFPVNLLFTAALFLTISHPLPKKPYISFILLFVFSQAVPASAEQVSARLACLLTGATLTAVTTVVVWRRRGYGRRGRELKAQLRACWENRSLVFRMSLGIALAMLAGMLLGLKKPLWISIVVMSLTQLEFRETLERIKYRSIATVVGVLLFAGVFQRLVPPQYTMALLLLLGYLTFFTPEYRHKQIYNAMSAINASLVLLDTTTAIANRFLCLAGGIAIVLMLFAGEKGLRALMGLVRVRREDGLPEPEGPELDRTPAQA